mgnify:CR=1 FL=1
MNILFTRAAMEPKQHNSHTFALYSLKMKLKRKRIRVDLDLVPTEFWPIKFDDQKCFIYKHDHLDYSASIMIYSFTNSLLLQQINISIPYQYGFQKMMAIDSECNNNLYFWCFISKTINCLNLQSKELITSKLQETIFNKLILEDNDKRLILSNTAHNILYTFEDNSFLKDFFVQAKHT